MVTPLNFESPAPPTRSQAVHSVFWAVFGALGRYILAGITALILTHLLAPDDFGLIALTAVAQALITIIIPAGFHDALIQRAPLHDQDLNAAFWSVVLLAGGCALLLVTLAPLLAVVFDQPALGALLVVVVLVSLLHALDTVPRALLNRRLDFRTLVLARLAGMLVGSAAAILVAVLGGGVWSLVVQLAVLNLITLIVLWRSTDWRPNWVPAPEFFSLWPFAVSVSTGMAISFLILNADDQLIGYRLGSESLGFYALAFSLIAWPSRDVLGSVASVLYPIFARVQQDTARMQAVYLESLQFTTAFAFPVLTWIAVTAPVLIPWLLGARWTPLVLTVQILTVDGLRASSVMLNGQVFRTKARPHLHMLFQTCSVGPYLAAILIGLDWGIEGVAFFYTLVGFILHPLSLWLVLTTLPIRPSCRLEALLPILSATLLMMVVAALTLSISQHVLDITPFPALLLTGSLSAVVYGGILVIWQPPGVARNIRAVWHVLRARA